MKFNLWVCVRCSHYKIACTSVIRIVDKRITSNISGHVCICDCVCVCNADAIVYLYYVCKLIGIGQQCIMCERENVYTFLYRYRKLEVRKRLDFYYLTRSNDFMSYFEVHIANEVSHLWIFYRLLKRMLRQFFADLTQMTNEFMARTMVLYGLNR